MLKIGKIKVKELDGLYCLNAIYEEYNRRYGKNRFLSTFLEVKKNQEYVREVCRYMNVITGAKTYNENSIFKYKLSEIEGPGRRSREVYTNIFIFSKFLLWSFPSSDLHLTPLIKKWFEENKFTSNVNGMVEWMYRNHNLLVNNFGLFDPLMYLRETALCQKYSKYGDSVKLNQSLLSAGVDFKERLIVMSKFYSK